MALLLALLVLFTPSSAPGSARLSQLFGSICVIVYQSDEVFKSVVRDDLADAITSTLDARVNGLIKGLRVSARPSCIRPGEPTFSRQMMVELYVSRRPVELDGKSVPSVVIGGSSPNVGGWLAPHELPPTLLLDRSDIDDRRITESLVAFFDSTVLALLRAETDSSR